MWEVEMNMFIEKRKEEEDYVRVKDEYISYCICMMWGPGADPERLGGYFGQMKNSDDFFFTYTKYEVKLKLELNIKMKKSHHSFTMAFLWNNIGKK